MCKFSNHVCFHGPGAGEQRGANLKQFSWLLVLALLLGVCPLAQADLGDDQYLQIYTLIQQADELSSSGKAALAKAKYQEAQTALKGFKTDYPSWNVKLVAYRLNYVAQKLAALSEKPRAVAADGAGTNAPEAQTGAQSATSTATTQVKLLEAGAEPRKVLRLHPSPGDKQTLHLTLKMAIETKMGEMQSQAMKLPAMTMTMDTTVKDVSDKGDITYELVMGETTLADDPGGNAQLAELMKTALGGIKGMSGTGTVSSRGLAKGMEFKVPSGVDAQTRQVMDQMRDSFSSIAAPLPEEAVGPGARWEAKIPIRSQGMTIDQTGTSELVSIEGDRLTTKSTFTQRASNQKVESPAMPGLKVDLIKMNGTGTGESNYDLGKLLPIAGTTILHSETDMAMNMGGQKQPISTKMDLNVRLESK
jgi:hypothetical protein